MMLFIGSLNAYEMKNPGKHFLPKRTHFAITCTIIDRYVRPSTVFLVQFFFCGKKTEPKFEVMKCTLNQNVQNVPLRYNCANSIGADN
jgi:hypothetical protein